MPLTTVLSEVPLKDHSSILKTTTYSVAEVPSRDEASEMVTVGVATKAKYLMAVAHVAEALAASDHEDTQETFHPPSMA